MTTIALLPLRSLRDGKQRLRDALAPAARTELVQALCVRALNALRESRCVDQIVVVSPDPELLVWVQSFNVWPVLQPDQGLNNGLEHARQVVLGQTRFSTLLIVLPDLPLIQPDDVCGLVALGDDQTVVVAPDRHERGTNALLLRPPDLLPFMFGEGSRHRHETAAMERGLTMRYYSSPSITLDLDTPDDLELAGFSSASLCLC
jgi:2-phospho-L-lactate guanylyltransferase